MKPWFSVLIISAMFCPLILKGQYINDWEARPAVGFNYKVNERINFGGTYYLYMNDNLSKYKNSVFSTDLSYKLINGLKLAIDYRFHTLGIEDIHEIRYQLNISQELGNDLWKLAVRPAVQHKIYKQQQPKFYQRTRVKLSYQISEKIITYALVEPYFDITDNFAFNTLKSAVGAEFSFGSWGILEPQITLKNKRDNQNYGRLELIYKFQF